MNSVFTGLLIGTALFAGCGGSPPEAQVREVVGRYTEALEARDGPTACGLMTEARQAERAESYRIDPVTFRERPPEEATCEASVEDRSRAPYMAIPVGRVETSGSTAKAWLEPRRPPRSGTAPVLTLVKTDGEWLVATSELTCDSIEVVREGREVQQGSCKPGK